MQAKRKAAANVFAEQQQNVVLDDEMGVPEPALPQGGLAGAAALPPPQEARDRAALLPPSPPSARPPRSPLPPNSGLKTSEELQLEKEPIRVRETGFWFWRRIIVPPNAYVVHTRMGRKEPVTLGLGISFGYNPYTDAYLVVPAAMQTIGIIANCISKEKQGLNVLAYVQWQINDFGVAYRKLDFSDLRDPLGIVNAQMREQAEAAIKDKIATMSVEEVLTDKEPIIEELTTRLKTVAEGRGPHGGSGDEGLGIKIVTVQIKEALVSSQRLWEHLQAPFRYEQEKLARISYLLAQDEIRRKELENRQLAETGNAETMVVIERITQSKQTEASEVRLTEEMTRFTREQESVRRKVQLEEETTLTQRESQQRVAAQAARLAQENKLDTLRREQATELARSQLAQETTLERLRQQQAETLAQAQLDAEASTRQKALQVAQAIQALTEEARLAEAKLQADQEALGRATTLREQEAAFQMLNQGHEAALAARTQEAILARMRQESDAQLAVEEATNNVRLAAAEREAEIARRQQEVRNLINEHNLASRLVEQLPALAAEMPEVHELKVLQTGGNGSGAFDALGLFLARSLAIAESLGIPLGTARRAPPPEHEA